MIKIFYFLIAAGFIFLGLFLLLILVKVLQLKRIKTEVSEDIGRMKYKKFSSPGSVKSCSVIPLVDFYAKSGNLKTEAGVSYLIKADGVNILLDTGFNPKREHPSPVLHNMNELGINPRDIDMIFISHVHLDHIGGFINQKRRVFSLSGGKVNLREVPVYAPGKISPSKDNPGPRVKIVTEPKVLMPGIASIGVIPRALFLIGRTEEHSLAINVKGKGIVLIIGCGHQSIERIIERTKMLFDEPIYAVIGGLHLPVHGGRPIMGFINIQHIVGADRPPWNGVNEDDVRNAINVIKKENPEIVSLSPHDSSDWSLQEFDNIFGNKYTALQAGKEIKI